MKNLTLKQLRYFDALARHRHFGRAAAASAISQPALSMQIRELEDSLGAPLFDRAARSVRLTGLGEEIAERVRGILLAVEELGDLAHDPVDGRLRRLRLGVIPTIAPYLLPKLVGELTAGDRVGDLRVRETQTATLVEDVGEGRLDAAIVALPLSEPAMHEEPLYSEDFVLVRPAGQAGQPIPDPDALQHMRLLLLEEGHCFRDQALSFCNLRTSLPRDFLEGSTLSTLVQMVGAGLGVTLIPDMARQLETRAAEVDIVRFPAPAPQRTIGMVWRRSSPLDAQLREVAQIVRAQAETAPS